VKVKVKVRRATASATWHSSEAVAVNSKPEHLGLAEGELDEGLHTAASYQHKLEAGLRHDKYV